MSDIKGGANNEVLAKVFAQANEILKQADLDDVTAESTGFSELPDGYYLAEVVKASFGESKSSHLPMISLQLKNVQEGLVVNVDAKNKISLSELKGTKNRMHFIYYVLKDTTAVRRMATDMLKFESEPGESLLPKEAFTTAETLNDSLEVIEGMRIYVNVSTSGEGDNKRQWTNLISWKRAAALELPIE